MFVVSRNLFAHPLVPPPFRISGGRGFMFISDLLFIKILRAALF